MVALIHGTGYACRGGGTGEGRFIFRPGDRYSIRHAAYALRAGRIPVYSRLSASMPSCLVERRQPVIGRPAASFHGAISLFRSKPKMEGRGR